ELLEGHAVAAQGGQEGRRLLWAQLLDPLPLDAVGVMAGESHGPVLQIDCLFQALGSTVAPVRKSPPLSPYTAPFASCDVCPPRTPGPTFVSVVRQASSPPARSAYRANLPPSSTFVPVVRRVCPASSWAKR